MAGIIDEQELLSLLFKALLKRWKSVTAIVVVFLALVFGGSWYGYWNVRVETARVMISLFDDIDKARKQAKQMIEETEKDIDETIQELNDARERLKEAEKILEENIGVLHKVVDESINVFEQQQQILQEEAVERKKPIPEPKRIERPQLRQIPKVE